VVERGRFDLERKMAAWRTREVEEVAWEEGNPSEREKREAVSLREL